MKEVRLPISMVEQVLEVLSRGKTSETGELFFGIRQLSQTQLKEFQDGQLEEKIQARLKTEETTEKP
jgi:hypothetical protein